MSYFLITISAIAKAIMDIISEGKWSGWWNKNDSWKNKWKNGDPEQGEKFFGSSTFLVWLTDGWHLFQAIFLYSLILGLILLDGIINPFLDFMIISVGFGIVFEISYRILKWTQTTIKHS